MEKLDQPQTRHVEAGEGAQENGGFDSIDREAIGGRDLSEMPRHYYRSPKVIGSILVSDKRPKPLSS